MVDRTEGGQIDGHVVVDGAGEVIAFVGDGPPGGAGDDFGGEGLDGGAQGLEAVDVVAEEGIVDEARGVLQDLSDTMALMQADVVKTAALEDVSGR